MALSTIATKPKNTTTRKSTPKKAIIREFLTPTNPYELLSERITGLDIKIDSIKNELSQQIRNVHTRVDGVEKSLNTRIDSAEKNLNTRIDATNTRIDSAEKNLSTRIDSLEKNTSSKFNLVLVFMGIGFSSILGLLSVMLSQML